MRKMAKPDQKRMNRTKGLKQAANDRGRHLHYSPGACPYEPYLSPEIMEEWNHNKEDIDTLSAAAAVLEKAVAHYRNRGEAERLKLAGALMELAGLDQQREDQQEALNHYQESLSVLQQLPLSQAATPMIKVLKQMGSLHYEMQHFPETARCFEEALGLSGQSTTSPSGPAKLEAAAMATLAAAIRMAPATTGHGQSGRHAARRLTTLAEQYLNGVDKEEGYLVDKQQGELRAQLGVLKRLL